MKNLIINPDVSVDKERNEVNDKIDHALINWLIKNSYNPIIISNETLILSKKKLNLFLNTLKLRGILLSGGSFKKNSIRYKFQNLLIDYAFKNNLPVLGICQGMQVIGVRFGSKLIKVKNHVRKRHKLINLSKERFPKECNSFHNYSLKNCPRNFYITTRATDGNIESIKHKNLAWEAWMWHPERDKKIDKTNNHRLKKIFK